MHPGVQRRLVAMTATSLINRRQRAALLRRAGLAIGRDTHLDAQVTIFGTDLSIGRGCFINAGCLLDATGPLRIGDRVAFGQRVTVITASHDLGPSEARAGLMTYQAVSVGDGAWIGAGAVILPGVTIGQGAVVAAGAVVNRDCKPDTLYAGVPAREVRSL